MEVIGKDVLDDATRKHAKLKRPLNRWLILAEACMAKQPMELRRTFGSVDPVPPKTVFDIMGNNFRLICEIDYELQVIIVTHVITHKEYETGFWKDGRK